MVLETERLVLRELGDSDAAFIVELLNDPDFVRFIGDKNVRTEDDARRYIREGPVASYAQHGHGLYHVSEKESGTAIGICGLVRRPALESADIGYAFLPQARGRGYASEAANAVMRSAVQHGYDRVLAIVSPDNVDSIDLLMRLGMREAGRRRMSPEADEVLVFEMGAA